MLIVLLIVAAVGVSAPVVGCVLISVASRPRIPNARWATGHQDTSRPGHGTSWVSIPMRRIAFGAEGAGKPAT